MTIPELELKIVLDQIFNSSEFREAKRYQDLLRFLVEESLKGNTVKETTIAHEVFGKDSKFDPGEDPSIRVYVSNLRKKLEHYYLTTSDKITHKIEIPKGQYTVRFVKESISQSKPAKLKFDKFLMLSVVTLFLGITVIYLLFIADNSGSIDRYNLKENLIWNEFLKSDALPTMVVLGDYLFLFEKTGSPSGGLFVRDGRINSEEDFRKVIRDNPALINKYVMLNFTYMRPSATWALTEILPILWNSPNKIYLKLASQFKWEDLKTHNVVFIGSFKTLYQFNKLIGNYNLKFSSSPSQLHITNNANDTLKSFIPKNLAGGNYIKDYGVIIKQRGPENNSILFLLGFDEVGILDAAKYSVDPKLIEKIKKFSPTTNFNSPFLFDLVIESEGVEQTGFKSRLTYFQSF